ncbi:MAG: ABC transporter permease [Gammaproteobacteria bacterium]
MTERTALGWRDSFTLALGALAANRGRSLLIAFATAIGVAAVVLLTALGEGARGFVVGQFEALGTNLLSILPGRNETTGGPPPILGTTPRDLTIDDAYALTAWPEILEVAPVMVGSAPVSVASGLEREVTVLGSTAAMASVRHLDMGQGTFLPEGDPHRAAAVCVLGYELHRELFGSAPAVGRWIRVNDRRFRVVGVLRDSGVSVGVDFNDLVIVPVASAQMLFDRESLFRVIASVRPGADLARATKAVHDIIASRHEGEDDVTVITQDSVVETLGRILGTITLGVAGISAISLAVAGILIMNVMLVAVTQRRAEIGLMKAIGARTGDVRRLFLIEAVLLAAAGALGGLAVGLAGAAAVAHTWPSYPVAAPPWAIVTALVVALGTGLVFGVVPARRAARLDPVEALARR